MLLFPWRKSVCSYITLTKPWLLWLPIKPHTHLATLVHGKTHVVAMVTHSMWECTHKLHTRDPLLSWSETRDPVTQLSYIWVTVTQHDDVPVMLKAFPLAYTHACATALVKSKYEIGTFYFCYTDINYFCASAWSFRLFYHLSPTHTNVHPCRHISSSSQENFQIPVGLSPWFPGL